MDQGRHRDPVLTAVPDAQAEAQRVQTAIKLDELRNPIVCDALETWRRQCGERRMPARADMGPRAMRSFLKYAALVQAIENGEFRFRVAGDAVVIQQGLPLQGITTAEIDARIPGYGSQLRRAYERVCRRKQALAYRGLYFRPADKHTFSHEAIMVPLGDDGETVDHVLIVAA